MRRPSSGASLRLYRLARPCGFDRAIASAIFQLRCRLIVPNLETWHFLEEAYLRDTHTAAVRLMTSSRLAVPAARRAAEALCNCNILRLAWLARTKRGSHPRERAPRAFRRSE